MIPVPVVKLLEHRVFDASCAVLRIFCGLGCLLTFGVKRCSDAQRMGDLRLTGDALMTRPWKSKKKKKKKKCQISWSALRSGFLERGWASAFLKELNAFGLPGPDYLLLAPKTDLLGFTKSPARWGDAERGIHAAFIDVGVQIDEAISYSLHSFNHLLVTAGRQLGLLEPSLDVMAG